MDTFRLQRASMAPTRFARLLESYSHDDYVVPPIEPIHTTSVDIGKPVPTEKHFLVPGGRFLITANPQTIDLWDLGAPDRAALERPALVARAKIGADLPGPVGSTQLAVEIQSVDTLKILVVVGLHHTT